MKRSNEGVGDQETSKRPVSLWKTLLILVIGMSAYAYAVLSTSKIVLLVAVVVFCILAVTRFVQGLRGSKTLETLCEAANCVVLVTFLFGAYRGLLAFNPTLLFATALYNPYFTVYRNRRLAFALGLLIMVVMEPICLGWVTNPIAVEILATLYALMVAGLWVFCSKLGTKVFGFTPDG